MTSPPNATRHRAATCLRSAGQTQAAWGETKDLSRQKQTSDASGRGPLAEQTALYGALSALLDGRGGAFGE